MRILFLKTVDNVRGHFPAGTDIIDYKPDAEAQALVDAQLAVPVPVEASHANVMWTSLSDEIAAGTAKVDGVVIFDNERREATVVDLTGEDQED